MPTVTIDLSDKYRFVINGDLPDGVDEPETEAEWNDIENADVADRFIEVVDSAPTINDLRGDCSCEGPNEACSECAREHTERHVLSWSDISPPSDSNLLRVMATYFTGIDPTDADGLIRAKLRILPVEHVANAQLAAQEERQLPEVRVAPGA